MKIFLTPEQAIDLLPERDSIHTICTPGLGIMFGADWTREDVIEALKKPDVTIEVTGNISRGMGHGICMYPPDPYYDQLRFIETDMDKLNELYPPEEEEE